MRYGYRADALVSVVHAGEQTGFKRAIHCRARDRRRRAGRHYVLSPIVGAYLLRLDAQHPGLVYLTPALVGSSNSRLLVRAMPRRRTDRGRDPPIGLSAMRRRRPPSGRGRARYLVLFRPVAVYDARLA